MRVSIVLCFLFSVLGVANAQTPYIQILGVAQDGGYPHIGCEKTCCAQAWQNSELSQWIVSFALADPVTGKWWLFEATPDIKDQLHYFHTATAGRYNYLPNGIFITHAHIGHYTGLMELGREALGSKEVPVYVLDKMSKFLETNGPWSQLVSLKNISIQKLIADETLGLTSTIQVTAFTVPHRDEFSETAGFMINTSSKKYLFIPDIDKWEKWNKKIVIEVERADIALLDATFYSVDELPHRDINEIPHPLVQETMKLFESVPALKSKIHFIHFNHTNPLLRTTEEKKGLEQAGFKVAAMGNVF
ncbi:MAG TPA: MBL fold metallo-hydrolase [Cyclobacteriaceae bacterium]|nr:MBL fold metallo-hydrolase [Cyclobacteriaceae bacterium]